MSLPNENVITILKELMEASKNGEQGYKDASDDIKDKGLSVLLFDYSVQRGMFVNDLRELIQSIGGDTEFTGSILGILNRRWMDVKYGAAGSNPFSILTECLKGDSEVLKKYEIHLKQDLPENIRQIIVQQRDIIKVNYDNISKLLEKHNLEIKNN